MMKMTDIKWIYEKNNPANFMTKSKLSMILRDLVKINKIILDMSKYMKYTKKENKAMLTIKERL